MKPLGFSLESKFLKRAGLDYWDSVNLHIHESWSCLSINILPQFEEKIVLSKQAQLGTVSLFDYRVACDKNIAVIFGNEEVVIPHDIRPAVQSIAKCIYVPMNSSSIRSYNLSNTVALTVSEIRRQYFMCDSIS